MKTLITYYSYSGNTDRVMNIFAGILKARGDVRIQRLKPKDEITGFAAQCRAAFSGRRAELAGDVIYDVSSYDLVVVGSPVWAFAPVPAMNTYLDKISGVTGKRAIVLLTSGSGLGVKRCFKHIANILTNKGTSHIDEINIPDRHNANGEVITASLVRCL